MITSGCSYTQYCWPTWADYLARYYGQHLQLGKSGFDCARIARGVIDSNISKDDILVICWTGFDRFNHLVDGEWQALGSVLSDKDFLVRYYDPQERFATMLDAMTLVNLHSRSVGYRVYHFSAFPWLLGEIEKTPHEKNIQYALSRDLNNLYMENDLETYKLKNHPLRISHKYNPHDDHPTPLCHWSWLVDVVLPVLTKTVDFSMENVVKLDQQRVLKGDVN